MSAARQARLVAVRELRERARSRAFRISIVVMAVIVGAVIVAPSFVEGDRTRDVGIAGAGPAGLAEAIEGGGGDLELTAHPYATIADGEEAVRRGDVDVLVIDARRLAWDGRHDEELRTSVVGAIQLEAVRERAAVAGLTPQELAAIAAPVSVEDVDLGSVAGRSADDETAAMVMTFVLFFAVATYGSLVLNGVVQEKSSRIVEVLLARMPARALLAGKVAGIGLLGLAQLVVVAVVALVATAAFDPIDLPAVRAGVLGWMIAWFVLGYALYATAYGVLGSLASRTEDADAAAGPAIAVLVVAYLVSFAAIGDPEGTLAVVASFFPATAPFAMPIRIAMGVVSWWQPLVAAVLTLATIAGLVRLGGRVYTYAILHTGPALSLRDAWRATRPKGRAQASIPTKG